MPFYAVTQYERRGVVCRDAVNDCDIPETCTGDSSQVESTVLYVTLRKRLHDHPESPKHDVLFLFCSALIMSTSWMATCAIALR